MKCARVRPRVSDILQSPCEQTGFCLTEVTGRRTCLGTVASSDPSLLKTVMHPSRLVLTAHGKGLCRHRRRDLEGHRDAFAPSRALQTLEPQNSSSYLRLGCFQGRGSSSIS